MELVLFPSYLCPSANVGVFHGGAIELGQIFVEFSVREEILSKCIGCGLLISEWNGNLFPIETSDVVSEQLGTSLLDVVEVAREFLKLLATGKLLYKGVRELGERGDGIVG